jgi:hypothetical protein
MRRVSFPKIGSFVPAGVLRCTFHSFSMANSIGAITIAARAIPVQSGDENKAEMETRRALR